MPCSNVNAAAAGSYCSRNWDGWLCWDDAQAGATASQSCPDYVFTSGPAGEQLKVGLMEEKVLAFTWMDLSL